MAMNDLNESAVKDVRVTTYPNGDVLISRYIPWQGWTAVELPAADALWIAERIIADHDARHPRTRTSSESFEVKAGG